MPKMRLLSVRGDSEESAFFSVPGWSGSSGDGCWQSASAGNSTARQTNREAVIYAWIPTEPESFENISRGSLLERHAEVYFSAFKRLQEQLSALRRCAHARGQA